MNPPKKEECEEIGNGYPVLEKSKNAILFLIVDPLKDTILRVVLLSQHYPEEFLFCHSARRDQFRRFLLPYLHSGAACLQLEATALKGILQNDCLVSN